MHKLIAAVAAPVLLLAYTKIYIFIVNLGSVFARWYWCLRFLSTLLSQVIKVADLIAEVRRLSFLNVLRSTRSTKILQNSEYFAVYEYKSENVLTVSSLYFRRHSRDVWWNSLRYSESISCNFLANPMRWTHRRRFREPGHCSANY